MSPSLTMIDSAGEWQPDWLAQGVRVHRSAWVDVGAVIGIGTVIWHNTHVRSTAIIGEACSIGQCCYVDADAQIGSRCKIANGVNIYSGVVIGVACFVGPNTTFTNDWWPRAVDSAGGVIQFCDPAKTRVCDGASIGAGCVILPVIIGARAMIGAGSVVTKDVAADTRYSCIAAVSLREIAPSR